MSEAELREILLNYERDGEKIQRLEEQRLQNRDRGLRRAHETGWRPVDIQNVSGLSREAVRQALNPEAREAARQALIERRAARKA